MDEGASAWQPPGPRPGSAHTPATARRAYGCLVTRTLGPGLSTPVSDDSAHDTEKDMPNLQDENKATVTRFNKEYIQGGDRAVFDATIAPDFVNHSAQPGVSAGPEGAAHFFQEVLGEAFPDLTVTIHDQVAEDDRIVTRKSYRATHSGTFLGVPATGRQVTFTVIDIIRLRDGRYIEHWANADMFGLLAQLRAA